ncbi:MAG: XdhC family protein, partial [Acidobacteriota bacterium]
AVVVRRRPVTSSQPGDTAIITASGAFHGWLGGSCTQPTAIREALKALADGRPRLVLLTPDPDSERRPGVDVFPMTCQSGGTVEIFLEPVLPAPRLVVFGSSSIARAVVQLGRAMGYAVSAVEEAVEDDPESAGSMPVSPQAPGFAVVATMGDVDEAAIRAALTLQPAYLGVVASARRFAAMRDTLLARGVPAEALDRIHCPAGLKIGARGPEEIALSILAEIVELRRAAEAQDKPAQETLEETTAIDPICGMTVTIASARHTAEHAGRTWYFCCGGCRERFLADPGRYAVDGAA